MTFVSVIGPYARRSVGAAAVLLTLAMGCPEKNDDPVVPRTSSQFLTKRPGNSRVLVFIHGVFGDLRETWRSPTTTKLFPEMLVTDPALPGFDVYLVGFDSPRWTRTMTLEEVSENVFQRLWDDKVFTDYSEIYFVAHSMGGLIAEEAVASLNTPGNYPVLLRVHAVITLSTPGNGASTAELASYLSANPQLKGMEPSSINGWIQKLQTRLQYLHSERDSMDAWFPRFYGAYETKPTGRVALVVSRVYALGIPLDAPLHPTAEDHVSIAKPDDPTDDVYVWVKARLLDAMKPAPPARAIAIGPKPPGAQGPTSDSAAALPSQVAAPKASTKPSASETQAVRSITVQLWTDTDDKDSEENVRCTVYLEGEVIGTGGPWGQDEVWGDQEDRQGGRPHIFDVALTRPLQDKDLRRLSLEVAKSQASGNGGKGWDFRLTLFAKRADGASVRILGETGTIQLGNGRPASMTVSLQ